MKEIIAKVKELNDLERFVEILVEFNKEMSLTFTEERVTGDGKPRSIIVAPFLIDHGFLHLIYGKMERLEYFFPLMNNKNPLIFNGRVPVVEFLLDVQYYKAAQYIVKNMRKE